MHKKKQIIEVKRSKVTVAMILMCRFFGGRCMDGKRRTNASFFHAGTSINTPTGRASQWAHMPGYQRAAWRSLGAFVVLGALYGFLFEADAMFTTIRVTFFCLVPVAVWAGWERGSEWTHRKKIIALSRAMSEKAGYSSLADPDRWIDAPKGYKKDPDKAITMTMHEGYNASEHSKKSFAKNSAAKLGLRDEYEEAWEEEERTQLVLKSKPAPRRMVEFKHVQKAFENVPDSELVIGLASRDKVRTVSLDSDSPHILASIGSGGGKSEFGKSAALQFLRKGGRVVIIDIVKRGASHKWAKGVAGVTIHRHAASAHGELLSLMELVESRCETGWHSGVSPNEQRILLIIEESNTTIDLLNTYWRQELEEQRTSPAVLAIKGILCVGREAKLNVLAVGQRMSAAASGGGDARENYGVRLGNRFSRQTANMLFNDVDPKPKSYNHPGLVQVVTSNKAELVQVPLLDLDSGALEWALSGTPQPEDRINTKKNRSLVLVGAGDSNSTDDTTSQTQETPDQSHNDAVADLRQLRSIEDEDVTITAEQLVGLSEAVNLEIVQSTLAVLRNERVRDPEFPNALDRRGSTGRGEMLYSPRDLVQWERNRAKQPSSNEDGGAS